MIFWIYRSRIFRQGIICQIWFIRSLRTQASASKIDLLWENARTGHVQVIDLLQICHVQATVPQTGHKPVMYLLCTGPWPVMNLLHIGHSPVMNLSHTHHRSVSNLSYTGQWSVMNLWCTGHKLVTYRSDLSWTPDLLRIHTSSWLVQMLNFHKSLHSKVGLIIIKVSKAPCTLSQYPPPPSSHLNHQTDHNEPTIVSCPRIVFYLKILMFTAEARIEW